jgi:hypothetical protein
MEIDALGRYIVGGAFLLAPIYVWWELWRTAHWPTTRARVIEIDPQSVFEDGALNLDSDYAIEYEVNGKRYLQTPDIENNVSVGGFKVARSPSVPREFRVRYDARDPSKYTIMHVYSRATRWAISVLCVGVGLYALVFAA